MTTSSHFDADLANPAVLAEPHEMFDQMRRDDPVYWSEPLGSWFVTSHELVPLGDKTIRAGQIVHLCLIAASHDPAVYADPHRLDITRAGGRSLAFGQGIHICMGGGLARCEVEVGITTLLARFPNLRLDPDRPPQRNRATLAFCGFHSLPVTF
jgi:cytochrome P450